MRLHLDRDRDEPLLWQETVRLEAAALQTDLLLEIDPIEVSGRVDFVDPEFVVGIDLRYDQAMACTRCLRPVRSAVAAHLDLRVITRPTVGPRSRDGRRRGPVTREARTPDPTTPHELELGRDELGALILEGEHLDTEPVIQEQVLLEVPMKPLCDPACRGLCPRCGADRNQTPECCAEPTVDERWEALGELRNRLSAEGR